LSELLASTNVTKFGVLSVYFIVGNLKRSIFLLMVPAAVVLASVAWVSSQPLSDEKLESNIYPGMPFYELRELLGRRGDYAADLKKLRNDEYFWSYGNISSIPLFRSRAYTFRFTPKLELDAATKKVRPALIGEDQFYRVLRSP
jgi:hypothetical protein